MKKILLSSVAFLGLTAGVMAADLPVRRAPAPIVAIPVFTWTGFYVGAQIGYQFSDNDDDFDNFGFVDPVFGFLDNGGNDDAFVLGAQAGYNVQLGSFVLGVEGDIEGVFGDDDNDFGFVHPVLGFIENRNDNDDWQASLRARAGVAFDRVLVYGTGGFAFRDSDTGFTVGAGVEYAFTNNLTARLEYRFTSIDRDRDNDFFVGAAFDRNHDDDFHTIRLGVSYKF